MKINKIILSSYLGLVVLFLLSIGIFGFAFKDKNIARNRINHDTLEVKFIAVDDFNHLSVGDNCHVILNDSYSNELKYLSDKQQANIEPKYELRNDTLFILSTEGNVQASLEINMNQIKSITCSGGRVILNNIKQEELEVFGDNASLFINNGSSISFANIVLRNQSDFQGWNFNGNALKLDLESSKAQFSANHKLKAVEGVLSSNSSVRLPKVNKITLESDESSTVQMY